MAVVLFYPSKVFAPSPAAPALNWWVASSLNIVCMCASETDKDLVCGFLFLNWMTVLWVFVCLCFAGTLWARLKKKKKGVQAASLMCVGGYLYFIQGILISLLAELVCCLCPEAAVLRHMECKMHTNTHCLCVFRDRAGRATPVNLNSNNKVTKGSPPWLKLSSYH